MPYSGGVTDPFWNGVILGLVGWLWDVAAVAELLLRGAVDAGGDVRNWLIRVPSGLSGVLIASFSPPESTQHTSVNTKYGNL